MSHTTTTLCTRTTDNGQINRELRTTRIGTCQDDEEMENGRIKSGDGDWVWIMNLRGDG